MTDKTPVQADGGGTAPDPAAEGEVASRRGPDAGGGESGGGAYPNPHTGKEESADGPGTFGGHGGQTDIAYHGSGQLGEEKVGSNANQPTRKD